MTYYHEEFVRANRRAFGVGVLIGTLVVASIWGSVWFLNSNGSGKQAVHGATTEQLDLPPEIPSITTTRLEACKEVFAAQTPLLEAVPRPLSQWRTQIAVMNKVVTGVMTLDEGMRFWRETRASVLDAMSRYRSAHRVFDERTARCPGPGDGRPLYFELQCSKAVVARDAELDAADSALGSWQQHIRDMERLRRGEITAGEATQLWPTTWREYVTELTTYRAAASTAKGQTC